jgi:protein-S-isoprenylcysteine O-methyltransferase Ste14
MKLFLHALAASLFGLVFFGVLLFWPAGTFNYWQAWVFIAIFTAVSSGPTMYWGLRKPEVLRRRMHAGPFAETRVAQNFATVGTIAMVVTVLVVSPLDHRFGWSQVPTPIVVIGDILVAVGLGIATMVVNQNSYAAATIRVEAEQPVISTGLCGLVRHPMYSGALMMMVGMPLALDSYWGLVTVLPGLAVLALRIVDEEKLLRQELAGYDEYTQKALPVGARRLVTVGGPPHDDEHRDHREPQHRVRNHRGVRPRQCHVDDVEDPARQMQHHQRRHDEA